MAARRRIPRMTARSAAALALGQASRSFPQLTPAEIKLGPLADPREVRLGLAILRTALQRWITIEHLLDQALRQPMRHLQPELRGVLLAAGAQILFLHRVPVHAAVDESVELTHTLVRPQAAGLVNAVLRKLAALVGPPVTDQAWRPDAQHLPLDEGYLPLNQAVLPDPGQDMVEHLAIACSCPAPLIRRWFKQYSPQQVQQLCWHGVLVPPTIVAIEDSPLPEALAGYAWRAHQQAGFVIWEDTHERLIEFIAAHRARRVQDPASALPAQATRSLKPGLIIDCCAGRGTKSKQLLDMHPQAQLILSDVSLERLEGLRTDFAAEPRMRVLSPDQLRAERSSHRADLLLLDVPCSNTAVLARRPEARYRTTEANLRSLVQLQRQIMRETLPLLAAGGHVLYATCSLERRENQEQARFLRDEFALEMIHEESLMPDGPGDRYRDGSYHALLRASTDGHTNQRPVSDAT